MRSRILVTGRALPTVVLTNAELEQQLDTIDLAASCAGFLYGMAIADSFVCTRQFTHVLVVAAEMVLRILDWQDRGTCVPFGDGAGAVVVGPEPQPL